MVTQMTGGWNIVAYRARYLVETNGYAGGDGNRRFRIYCWTNPPVGNGTLLVTNDFDAGANELSVSAIV